MFVVTVMAAIDGRATEISPETNSRTRIIGHRWRTISAWTSVTQQCLDSHNTTPEIASWSTSIPTSPICSLRFRPPVPISDVYSTKRSTGRVRAWLSRVSRGWVDPSAGRCRCTGRRCSWSTVRRRTWPNHSAVLSRWLMTTRLPFAGWRHRLAELNRASTRDSICEQRRFLPRLDIVTRLTTPLAASDTRHEISSCSGPDLATGRPWALLNKSWCN